MKICDVVKVISDKKKEFLFYTHAVYDLYVIPIFIESWRKISIEDLDDKENWKFLADNEHNDSTKKASQQNYHQKTYKLGNRCRDTIKCNKYVAHQLDDYFIQQKRKQLVEQQKINRSKLLINTSNLQYQYDQADFPVPVPIFTGAPPSLPSGNYSAVLNRQSQLPQQLASQEKQTTKRNEYLEQILLSTMSNLESRISTSISSLSSQISEIETKIDRYNDQLNTLEHDVYEILIPAIQSITEIITTSRQGKKEQLTNITKSIIKMRQNREQKINHISRNTNAELSQSIFSNVDES
ncbi:unnamed protein product [Rotaria sp. Silwood1]|nr:unnamed protein product [Rotaria sp. Silwood1]CAF4940861.1 unnamed protein product [Rotaria sp. Silwood1]